MEQCKAKDNKESQSMISKKTQMGKERKKLHK